eukprot:1158157-Pelagomonas_calceolata.AAC.2
MSRSLQHHNGCLSHTAASQWFHSRTHTYSTVAVVASYTPRIQTTEGADDFHRLRSLQTIQEHSKPDYCVFVLAALKFICLQGMPVTAALFLILLIQSQTGKQTGLQAAACVESGPRC